MLPRASLLLAPLLTVILTGCLPDSQQREPERSEESSSKTQSAYQDKDWTLNNLAGEAVTLSDFQGRPTLLVFWATWCPYCKKLLPGIAELNDKYESQGLKVLAVNIYEDWKPDVYWRNHEYTFDTVLEGDAIAAHYGVKGTPSLIFIAPSGEVIDRDSFSDPKHPKLEKFAIEGIAMMKKGDTPDMLAEGGSAIPTSN